MLWPSVLTVIALAPSGPLGVLAFFETQILLTLAIAVVGVAAAVVGIFVRRRRRRSLAAILTIICAVLLLPMGLKLAYSEVRMLAFDRLAQHSSGLIQAIRQYEITNGAPPESLADLVPRYLPAVPRTGIAAYPDYHYRPCRDLEECDGNHWIVLVPAPFGVLNWDEFIYYPLGNYPETDFRGWLEPVRDWAYVHE